mgnify:CR=1 FL=1
MADRGVVRARRLYTGAEDTPLDDRAIVIEAGRKLADLRKRIDDCGLTVESAISFPRWIVDDDATGEPRQDGRCSIVR